VCVSVILVLKLDSLTRKEGNQIEHIAFILFYSGSSIASGSTMGVISVLKLGST
jgi:hypothetical protein